MTEPAAPPTDPPTGPPPAPGRGVWAGAWASGAAPLLAGAAGAVVLTVYWHILKAIDAAVPLLAAALAGTAAAGGAADLAARLWADRRRDLYGKPAPVRRAFPTGVAALALAAALARVAPWRGTYGFLPIGAAFVGVWCLGTAVRGWWSRRREDREAAAGADPAARRGGRFGGLRAGRREEHTSLTAPGGIALGIAGVLLLGAFLGPSNMLLLVCCLVVGPVAADGWFAVGVLRRCRAERTAPAVAAAGEVALIELTLSYRGRLLPARQVTATDRLRNRREDLPAAVTFTRVRPRGEATGVYRFEPRVRGRHRLGPITLAVQFPLGLVRREVVEPAPGGMLVLPAVGEMLPAWRRRRRLADELAATAKPRRGLFEDEFYQLREYRPGDGPQAIHWRSSAKAGELTVRENHESRDRDLALYVDLHGEADRPADDAEDALRERAVSLAATLIADHLRNHGGATVSLRTGGAGERVYVGRAGGDLTAPLSELALAEAGPVADPGPAAFAAAAAASPAARRVCVTTRDPADPTLAAADGGGGWEVLSARPSCYEEVFACPPL